MVTRWLVLFCRMTYSAFRLALEPVSRPGGLWKMRLVRPGRAGAAEGACGARSAPSDSGTATAIAIMRSLLISPPGNGLAPGPLASSRLLTVVERVISQA